MTKYTLTKSHPEGLTLSRSSELAELLLKGRGFKPIFLILSPDETLFSRRSANDQSP